jgi:hypothetical protein
VNNAPKLPKRSREHVIAEKAVRVVTRALPSGWIVRDQPVSDYGIDLEIELAGSIVTGLIFKGQVKGHSGIAWEKDGTFLQPLAQRTMNYWRQFRVPVVLFAVDTSCSEVYWSKTQEALASGLISGIRVRQGDSLPRTLDALASYVVNWADLQTTRQTLYSMSLLSQRLDRRLAEMDGDCFLAMDTDEVEETRDLYEQIIRFAHAAGVNVSQMLPWELWIARSGRTWGDEEALTFGTHDEAVLYMKSVFEEALEKAMEIIDAEDATPDNAHAKAFVEYKRRRMYIGWRFDNRFQHLTVDDWTQIERRLQARGALKFPLHG